MSTLSHDPFERGTRTSSSSSTNASISDPGRFSADDSKESLDALDRSRESDSDSDYAYDPERDQRRPLRPSRRTRHLNGKVSHAYPSVASSLSDPEKFKALRRSPNLTKWLIPRRPLRCLCFLLALLATLFVTATLASGLWAYKRAPLAGASPPWYPTPRGGTSRRWDASYARAAALVRNMTLVEKVNVTTGTGWQMGACVGNTGPAARVGFPALCLQDGPAGLRFADRVTAGPAGVTVGATWNKELMYKRGRMLGLEARVKGVNVLLGPSVGPLGRMPAGGRNWEGFGADPVLQGLAAAETIRGIQEEGVMATIKHYVGNEQEHYRQAFEWGLPNAISSNIDDRTLHELYAWPFADSIRAGVASVMCSYNQVNNSYACQNSKLLNGVLKDELGFQGFVQSDWLAQRSGVASALAGLDMSMPGDGQTWANGKPFWGSQLTLAILNGSLPAERLDDMVTRIVAAWYQVGQNDTAKWPKPPPEGNGGPNFSSWTDKEQGLLYPGSKDSPSGKVNSFVDAENAGSYSHQGLARRIAAEGTVLLKNSKDILPLTRKGWSKAWNKTHYIDGHIFNVAIIGEDSTANPKGPNGCPDRGCNKGTLATGWGSGTVEFPFLVTPVEGLKGRFYNETVVVKEYPTNDMALKRGPSGLEDQDLCIVFVNADAGEGFIASDGIKGDRNDLNLQKNGDALIQRVANTCGAQNPRNSEEERITGVPSSKIPGNTIVVIHAVGPVILESFIEHPNIPAVIFANLPGEHSGSALADVIFGDINPSGHLPFTIGKSLKDYGPGGQILFYPNSVIPQQDFNESLLIDYRHFDTNYISPRFEFGYGLTYTSFSLHNLTITPASKKQPLPLPDARPKPERDPPRFLSSPALAGEALFPPGFRRLGKYIYPYINSVQDVKHGEYPYPPTDLFLPSEAGGGEGGNPALWETIANVTVTLKNDGPCDGQAVLQLYVAFPTDIWEDVDDNVRRSSSTDSTLEARSSEPNASNREARSGGKAEKITFPHHVLRGFDKVQTQYDEKGKNSWNVTFSLTRRDLSYWSVRKQNWVLPHGPFGIKVGFSSRDLRVEGPLAW